MMLKIYIPEILVRKDMHHVIMLYPFMGLIPEPEGSVDHGRFDEYAQAGRSIFSPVPSIPDADIVVLPYEWKSRTQWKTNYDARVREANKLAADAGRHGKRVIIFFNNDSEESIPVNNSIVFRTSLSRRNRRKNEFAFPGWSVDFLRRYFGGNLAIREKRPVPTVGYCGYVDFVKKPANIISHKIRMMRHFFGNEGIYIRGNAVRRLLEDGRIVTNFILREKFSGFADDMSRQEYANNMAGSDYLLAARGAGNFSYRFYELLSCGRIPVFIDTDCVLPFDQFIDWKKYCVWIDSKEIGKIGDRIIEYHDNVSEMEFGNIQRSIRGVYEEWISPAGFFRNLWKCVM